MPIYAYKCSSCGHEKDVLQKVSDAPLANCPACGSASFAKRITAAGFQLKGSGWYVTDFRNGSTKPNGGSTDSPADGKPAGSKTESGEAKPAAASPAPAAAPASGSGSCAACT